MILDKYTMKRKLGKGAYGEVLLVQDDKGNNYALKLITMKSLKKQTYLLQYLQGEIQCMKDIDSPYVMRLYKTAEDQDYKYLFCEYCDGGDLLNLQSKQNGRVFTLEKACEVMSEVIKGLYDLHEKGYLHRDIKSQNILVKMDNGKETFKLADFGFSKKFENICATILGTQTYMSPQIFKNQGYGYEVDMWAFGVLFYFMLNMEFPFKINPHDSPQKKQIKLEEAGKNFSYKKYVKQSKKKLVNNCTQEVEQLFKQIFHPQADQRITFAQIRQTKLFMKYFPQKNQASRILYNQKKFINKLEKKQIQIKPKKQENDMEQNIRQTVSVIKRNDKNYPKQKALLSNKKDSIDFLRDNTLEFLDGQNVLKPEQKHSLSFNLLKYYIILIRQFIDNLNPTALLKAYPNMQWQGFSKTNAFKQIKSEAEQDKLKMQVKFDQLYDQCSYLMKQIEQLNPKFKAAYEKQITQKGFEGAFRDSYRKSTNISFNTIRTLIRNSARTGNILNYNLAILVISHVFNHIFNDKQNMQKIFAQYFTNKNKTVQTIDYEQLREWMTKATASQLNNLAKQIIKLYFS